MSKLNFIFFGTPDVASETLEILKQGFLASAGFDEYDFSSRKIDFNNSSLKKPHQTKVGYFSNLMTAMSLEYQVQFEKALDHLKKQGFEIIALEADLNLFSLLGPLYKCISYSEAVSCYSNLIGITFGPKINGISFEEAVINNRSIHLGDEIKRRFMIGSFATSADNAQRYYEKSLLMKKAIAVYMQKILSEVDFILTPSALTIAPKIGEVKKKKLNQLQQIVDDLLVVSNFSQQPSLTIP
jgi:aspartyl-tRNA(Asn)/glutamyl-tRNA(Gln) amidotransferase subunit A